VFEGFKRDNSFGSGRNSNLLAFTAFDVDDGEEAACKQEHKHATCEGFRRYMLEGQVCSIYWRVRHVHVGGSGM
jgi:hypothetical protein